jgi:two-component system NtrC family sensor kinase
MEDGNELAQLTAEVERLRDELARAYKDITISRLAAGIFHEMNTPLSSIFSNNDVLQKSTAMLEASLGPNLDRKTKALLETIRTLLSVDRMACERISGIVRSLKVHARLEDGRFAPIQLNELVNDAIRLVNAEHKRRVKIETDLGDLPPVEGNAQLMSQALLNILVNAAQAIVGEGQIQVRTSVEGEMAHIAIQDTGCGINEDCRKKIFSMGYSTKPIGVGTGLGLALTRKIVMEKHHGTIDFESEPGKGTTFHIRIPLQQPTEKESQ